MDTKTKISTLKHWKKALNKNYDKISDQKKERPLTTDSSEYAIISQDVHSVTYQSRKLTTREKKNYSNIEKEALADKRIMERVRNILLGRKFLIISGHKPLDFIFNPKNELPRVTSSRTRRGIKLIAFDLDINGKTTPHVDALFTQDFGNEKAVIKIPKTK